MTGSSLIHFWKYLHRILLMHVVDELIGTSGYNMMSPISTYNGIPSQPTLPSAPYTPFYPTNTNQAAPLPDFTIPSYLNFRQSGKYI